MVDFAGSPLRPRWVYNDGSAVDYLMSVPQRPWDFGSRGLGGSDTSAAGVPAAFEIRRDYLLHLTLRFPESEWDDVARLMRHLQRAGSATVYPDQDEVSVSHTVYGDAPRLGEEIRPRRSSFPAVLELDVSVRRTTAVVFGDAFYGDLLFYWEAGTRVDGMVFTRSGTAYYVDRDGVLKIAAANVERTEWVGPGFGTPTLLLEDARTNGWTYSEQLDNAAWTKSASSISANAVSAPDGATTADKIVEDIATDSHSIFRNTPSATNDTDQAITIFAKAAERTELRIDLFGKDGTSRTVWFNLSAGTVGTTSNATGRITALADGWYRCEVVADVSNGGTTPQVIVRLGSGSETVSYTGDGSSGLYVWGIQFEADQPFASSYIQTVASTVTRNAETCSFPFVAPPQEMTVYTKFIEGGTITAALPALRLFHIGAASATADPRLSVFESGGNYAIIHDNGTLTPTATLAAAPSIGDTGEIRGVLNANGSVLIGQSVNSGAETTAQDATAAALRAAWAGQLGYLNSGGTGSRGFNKLRALKIARGAPTMEQLRVMFS